MSISVGLCCSHYSQSKSFSGGGGRRRGGASPPTCSFFWQTLFGWKFKCWNRPRQWGQEQQLCFSVFSLTVSAWLDFDQLLVIVWYCVSNADRCLEQSSGLGFSSWWWERRREGPDSQLWLMSPHEFKVFSLVQAFANMRDSPSLSLSLTLSVVFSKHPICGRGIYEMWNCVNGWNV